MNITGFNLVDGTLFDLHKWLAFVNSNLFKYLKRTEIKFSLLCHLPQTNWERVSTLPFKIDTTLIQTRDTR